MTNREEIFQLIEGHPEGLDDDDISRMTGIQPRQQVQQLCNQLADSQRIRRQSVGKTGKRRKIHNFPGTNPPQAHIPSGESAGEWHKRLAALVAATGRSESELLEESLHLLALRVLQRDKEGTPEFP
jgi:hypothetical protein